MRMEPAQIVRSAQVWVCRGCGVHDNKSCTCRALADPQEIAAEKKEDERQRARANREKAKGNQLPRTAEPYADVENVKEIDDGADEPVEAPSAEINGFIRNISEWTTTYSAKLQAWRAQHPKLPQDGRAALVRTLHQCADEVLRLAQAIDGR